MRFENTEVFGFENAILGARLPMCTSLQEAKEKSDSFMCDDNATVKDCEKCRFLTDKCELGTFDNMYVIGEKDMDLMKRLIKADNKDGASGQPNSKFLRQIHVQVCITAPDYFFRELDTYKVGTVRNSSSQMHKLASTPITMDCFEIDDFEDLWIENEIGAYHLKDEWEETIYDLETLRKLYNETKDKRYWKELVRKLPQSWLYTSMFDCDYATLRNICSWRSNHKLNEWSGKDKQGVQNFMDWVSTLPYAKELLLNE